MTSKPEPVDSCSNRSAGMGWWHDAKFGVFVHWGCYSVLGRGEQILLRDFMPIDEYREVAEKFSPAPDWADRIAEQVVRAGARYVVLTTRHHDGYCLFNTSADSFNSVETGPGRDLVSEFVQAVRKRGLRIGLYYSLINWRWRAFWEPDALDGTLQKMVDEVHHQVRELLTNYGHIDILWYDAAQVPGAHTPGAFGYQTRPLALSSSEFYRSAELNAMARQLQPHILINNRCGEPGDFGTPEQHITPEEDGHAWEACMTINNPPNWGNVHYSVADKNAGEILYNLIQSVRLGGNFLFNIGPDRNGYVTQRDRDGLDRIGKWLHTHGEAVYGTSPEGIYPTANQGPCYHYGMFTCRSNRAYLTLFYYPGDYLIISKLGPAIRRADLLTTGETLTVERMSNERWKISGLPQSPPGDLAPVIRIEFESPPYLLQFDDGSWLDGHFEVSSSSRPRRFCRL